MSACGGGGGSGSPPPPPPPPPPANQPPVVASVNGDKTGSVGYDFSYDATQSGATFSDPDGDTLTYSVSYAPGANGLSDANGVISGVPNAKGDITVTITADDGKGGSVSDSFIVAVTIQQTAVQAAFGGTIDLDNLENYANQTVPAYITKFNDGGNPISDAGATLGRVLFYDKALSIDDTVSCSSCHVQSLGFSDPDLVSGGVQGGVTFRHSMRLINTQFASETRFFWDERAASHEDQESQPIQDHNEHGFSGQNGRPDLAALITKLEGMTYYEELFRFVYLDPNITEARLQQALAQFVKSIHSFDSKYDAGRAQVSADTDVFPNFTADENAGKDMFLTPKGQGGAGCGMCHRAPEFDIVSNSNQNGIIGVANQPLEFDLTNTRAPTLRDLVNPNGGFNGPFMHDEITPRRRGLRYVSQSA